MISLRTMRRLDRLIGGALCAGLARLGVGKRRCGRDGKPGGAVLFIGLAEMGSVVLADPALRRARDAYSATPHFLIFSQNRDSLGLTGTVQPENSFHLRTDSLFSLALDTIRFMAWARRRGIAVAVDTDPCSNFSALLALLSGAARRAGFRHAAHGEGGRAALFDCGAPYRPDLHLAQNLLLLVDAALGSRSAGTSPAVPPLPAVVQRRCHPLERLAVRARLQAVAPDFEPERQRILLVNPNIGDLLPQRRWPRDNYVRLIDGILARHSDVFVFLLGGKSDAASVLGLEAEIGSRRCRTIAGVFDLAELPALFACSALLLSSDSGPAHFAAVTPLPVIVLFGPETPARYRPLGNASTLFADLECSPCIRPDNGRRIACRDNRCLRAIGVATVMAEVERRLEEGRALQPCAAPASDQDSGVLAAAEV